MNHYYPQTGLLAEKLVNTCDPTRAEPEFLRTPADLTMYLNRWNYPYEQEPDAEDLVEVLAVRRQLRSVFESGSLDVAVRVLNELLQGIQVSPHVGLAQDGTINVELEVGENMPLARRLGAEAALGLSDAIKQYGIERLSVCSASPCIEVFIDTSRNHTRRYCCEQCANRHNVAAYRRRKVS